jgi:hypothetical protein
MTALHRTYYSPATTYELEGAFAYEVAPGAAAVDWCRLRREIVAAAVAEEPRWKHPNGTPRVESEPSQLNILRDYWMAVPEFARPADALRQARGSAADRRDFEWSAAFICFVMRTAGVRRQDGFEFSRRHMNYVVGAMRNREQSDRNRGFWLVDRVELEHEATPQPGDLLCFNRRVRPGVWTNHSYHSLRRDFWEGGRAGAAVTGSSHCAIIVAVGRDARGPFLQTIGGNEANSVLRRRIPLTPTGQIDLADRTARRIFGMIKLVGC